MAKQAARRVRGVHLNLRLDRIPFATIVQVVGMQSWWVKDIVNPALADIRATKRTFQIQMNILNVRPEHICHR